MTKREPTEFNEERDTVDTANMESDIPSVVTGSRVYGPYSRKSDIDIVVNVRDASVIALYLDRHGIASERTQRQKTMMGVATYSGFYFRIGGLLFNIIIANSDEEMAAWEYATESMMLINEVEDRGSRIKKFREFYKEALSGPGI